MSAGKETETTRVVNQVGIGGPIERVFDAVTTTCYWPRWHPATISVGGVTDRPIALGDVIHERARIGARVYEGDWTVAEHARPSRVVLSGRGGRIRIVYTFASDGPATTFQRELEFRPEDFLGGVAEPDARAVRSGAAQSESAGRGTSRDERSSGVLLTQRWCGRERRRADELNEQIERNAVSW